MRRPRLSVVTVSAVNVSAPVTAVSAHATVAENLRDDLAALAVRYRAHGLLDLDVSAQWDAAVSGAPNGTRAVLGFDDGDLTVLHIEKGE